MDHIPFSEQRILALQRCFLTPGFHAIQVDDLSSGRIKIQSIVQSLKCYKRVGYLSSSSYSCIADCFFDLYNELREFSLLNGKANEADDGAIEDYLLNLFQADLLCIEIGTGLLRASWFYRLEQLLIDFGFVNVLPIILLFANQD